MSNKYKETPEQYARWLKIIEPLHPPEERPLVAKKKPQAEEKKSLGFPVNPTTKPRKRQDVTEPTVIGEEEYETPSGKKGKMTIIQEPTIKKTLPRGSDTAVKESRSSFSDIGDKGGPGGKFVPLDTSPKHDPNVVPYGGETSDTFSRLGKWEDEKRKKTTTETTEEQKKPIPGWVRFLGGVAAGAGAGAIGSQFVGAETAGSIVSKGGEAYGAFQRGEAATATAAEKERLARRRDERAEKSLGFQERGIKLREKESMERMAERKKPDKATMKFMRDYGYKAIKNKDGSTDYVEKPDSEKNEYQLQNSRKLKAAADYEVNRAAGKVGTTGRKPNPDEKAYLQNLDKQRRENLYRAERKYEEGSPELEDAYAIIDKQYQKNLSDFWGQRGSSLFGAPQTDLESQAELEQSRMVDPAYQEFMKKQEAAAMGEGGRELQPPPQVNDLVQALDAKYAGYDPSVMERLLTGNAPSAVAWRDQPFIKQNLKTLIDYYLGPR
jgi:hypothetical protein